MIDRIYYMAECHSCHSKVPFRTRDERTEWVGVHTRSHVRDNTPPRIEQWIAPRKEAP